MRLKVKLESSVFKGWGTYHLSLVAVFAAILLFAGLNALLMRTSGGYDIKAEAILPYSADQLWQWTIENDKRSKWQVGMYDLSSLHGAPSEIDSTRMLFFISGEKKWNGVEITLESSEPSQWVARQEMPTTLRKYSVTLGALSACHTVVRIHEQSELFDFKERFWLFWRKSDHQERLNYSLRQLKTWMGHKGETCEE